VDGEPSVAAQTKCIAKCNDIDSASVAGGADNLARGDGNCRRGKADRQVIKVNSGGRRLRRWTEAREPLLTAFDHTSGADADEVPSEEAGGRLRRLRMEPLVFDLQDGVDCSVVCRRLRGCAKDPREGEQSGDEKALSQILMKIFLR
jgi:hypothetical protein